MRLLSIALFMLCASTFCFDDCMAQNNPPSDTAIIRLDIQHFSNMPAPDIAQLKSFLKNRRVVMLGEATHGDGNVQELKTMMVKFLHEELGFDMLAFESGFYDLYKANKNIQASYPFKEALAKSIFSIWTNSQQCQGLWEYLEKKRTAITLAGFDPQLSGEYGRNMITDLEEFLEQLKVTIEPDFDMLENVTQHMADHFSFPASYSFNKFENEINQIITAFNKITISRTDLAFWKQAMSSILALANDYYHNNPSAKNEQTFKAADSNPRDRQMALNLLFLLKQFPEAKVICWGATTHFMNDPSALHDNELSNYVPMGKILKDALGDKVCIIGATAGSGSYGIFGKNIVQLQSVPHSLEEQMDREVKSYGIIPLKNRNPAVFTSLVVEHKPLTGKWQNVLDAILYVPQLSPSVFYSDATERSVEQVVQKPAATASEQINPARKLMGKVVDKTALLPVPFASVVIKGTQSVTLVSNNAGLFEWPSATLKDSIEISCIGYKTLLQPVPNRPPGKDTLYFMLTENAGMLKTVVVRLLEKDPLTIMKKVIDKRNANLPVKDFTATMYVHETLKEKKDTIRDVEYITDIYSQKGYSKDFSIQSGIAELKWNKKLTDSVFRKTGSILNTANTAYLKAFNRIDYLYNLPLFDDKNKLKYYQLKLDSITTLNDEQVFVVSFDSKRKSERYTFSFNVARFYGTVYVNSSDYAILKYDITVESDTGEYNTDARKYFNRQRLANDKYFWSLLKSKDVMTKNVIYTQKDGVYIPVYASLTHRQQGISQLSQTSVSYLGAAEFYLYDFKWGSNVNSASLETSLYKFSKAYNPTFWNNLVKPVSNAY